jgi:Flp pilus assembly protein TadD
MLVAVKRAVDAESYAKRGVEYHEKGDNDRAVADYTQALKIDPNNRQAAQSLETAKRLKGR